MACVYAGQQHKLGELAAASAGQDRLATQQADISHLRRSCEAVWLHQQCLESQDTAFNSSPRHACLLHQLHQLHLSA